MALKSLLPRLPALALAGAALYYAVWGGEYSALDLRDLARRQEQETARLTATRAQVDSLRAVGRLLEDDPATLEALARERFGMIRDGETLYRFVDVAPAAPPSVP